MRIRKSILAEDSEGHEVLITPGDVLSEIQDAGPVESNAYYASDVLGWRVSFRFTPKHKLWTEIVTCDAIMLLKALEGQ